MSKRHGLLPLILSAALLSAAGCQAGRVKEIIEPIQTETSETGELESGSGEQSSDSITKAEHSGERDIKESDTKESNTKEADEKEADSKGTSSPEPSEGVLGVPLMSREDYPKVNGSTATIPLSQALYRLSTGATEEEAASDIVHDKTTNSYMGLINGYNDLVIAYEAAESVFEEARNRNVELDIRPIGKDALVFLTNEGNPVQSLTDGELADIYTGKITNWSQVGGRDKEIAAFQRPDGSGSQTLMKKLVMKDREMAEAPTEMISSEMGELIEALADYNNEENALGYSVYYYAHNMYNMPGLRLMGVNQVSPDNQSIRNGTYPYVNEFYAAVRKDEPVDSNAYRLFQWLTSSGGQIFVESMGYVAVSDVKETKELFPEEEKDRKEVLAFGENERLIVNKDITGGQAGSLVIDRNLNVVDQEKPYSYSYNFVDILELNQPVQVIDNESGQSGVVRFGTDEVMVPLIYDYIREWNGFYLCELWDDDGNRKWTFYDKAGKVVKELEGSSTSFFDTHFWCYGIDRTNVEIYDSALNLVKNIDLTQYGTLKFEVYGYNSGFMIFQDDNYVMWNIDGTDVFDSREIPAGVWEYPLHIYRNDGNTFVQGTTPYKPMLLGRKWIVFAHDQDCIIYDREKKKVTAGPDLDIRCFENELCYLEETDGVKRVHDADGKVLTSPDGTGYTLVLGNGYFGYAGDGQIVVENNAKGERFVLEGKFNRDSEVTLVADRTFLASTYPDTADKEDGKCYLFRGGQKLMERHSIIYSPYRGKMLTDRDSDDKLILDDNGEIIYASKEKEYLYLATPDVVVTMRGNYLCILDSRGKCVLKMLSSYMADD